ncbi:MAG: hypothetical protein JF887_14120 [Candidatus Dormibacteraeota bacterium]|uniref:Uncharacterized protein n=1 Tax=Candidatus Amunia macphersoniae TaxID=3127014 RepID=A0A934KH77_9BACT|nr:hypothetical protein [Candidatus Dormibacteraeota bacterium]
MFAYKTVNPGFAHTGGHYLDDAREADTVPDDADLFEHPHDVKGWAIAPDIGQRLWEVSLNLVG